MANENEKAIITTEKTMNNLTLKEIIEQKIKPYFSEKESKRFENEKLFVLQAISENSTLKNCAEQNPVSLIKAMSLLAKTDLSLNPITKLAYLIPSSENKKLKVELRVSYIGLLRGLYSTGAIKSCQVEVICENDFFEFKLGTKAFVNHIPPFENRGNIKGAYCIITLQNDAEIIEIMNTDELQKVRDVAKFDTIWKAWTEEMSKKTVIKRAIKKIPILPIEISEIVNNDNQDYDLKKAEKKEEKIEIDMEFIE